MSSGQFLYLLDAKPSSLPEVEYLKLHKDSALPQKAIFTKALRTQFLLDVL